MKQAMMTLPRIGLIALAVGITGCTSTQENVSSVLDYDADTSYRDNDDKLAERLEMPPNLLMAGRQQRDLKKVLAETEGATQAKSTVPTYEAKNLSIERNLSQRWMAVKDMDSQKVFAGVEAFLQTLGMPVKEARKDIGVIKTEFVPRQEVVPLDDQGPLTRLLNSWRPEIAEGAYDRMVAQVEYDPEQNLTRVYFRHFQVYDPSLATDDGGVVSSGWQIQPYDPLFEAEALYQAMVFFGANQAQALTQIEATETTVEIVGGEEFDGLAFKAGPDETWNHLKAMLYRAGWFTEEISDALRIVTVQVPEKAREDQGFFESLAFWKSSNEKIIPKQVRFRVMANEDDQTLSQVSVEALEDATPLNADNREYIFKSLGLVTE
ncbi:outer membrane protein assembly factor BamC [Thiomicrospira sp. WB1]|uniref:outer membrane protein assembly factor BamC n=1 Tax=Thiomicrospira sp. WB1 TaxID=1685380 RepID=UPI000749D38E|nr:outer membrane protein assembly factor BamC [Thiomicrospira sp. WB1]KUJ72987.1 hypothetical protein AVO41_04275 [Thiomicrospira sp. WB1]